MTRNRPLLNLRALGCGAAALFMTTPSWAEEYPFTVGGAEYVSEEAFVKAGRTCGTADVDADTVHEIDAALRDRRANGQAARAPYGEVKVYFHVIHNGSTGLLGKSTAEAQMAVLNAAFAGTGIFFTLEGFDRNTDNANLFRMSDGSTAEWQAKSLLRRGGRADLNIYTAAPSSGVLGWATQPWEWASNPTDDGVVIDYRTVPGGTADSYNEGDTLVHEVGHWVGLFHTYQGGCTAPADSVDDTPAEKSAASGCPTKRNTCPALPGKDPVKNYMDSTSDACRVQFTADQIDRMNEVMAVYRAKPL